MSNYSPDCPILGKCSPTPVGAHPARWDWLSSTSRPSLVFHTLPPMLASRLATSPWSPLTASYNITRHMLLTHPHIKM